MTRLTRPPYLFWLASLLLLAGCRGDERLPVELPAPSFAVDRPILDGLGDLAIDVRRDVFAGVSSRYKVTEAYITHSVFVDSSVTWEEIRRFYSNELSYSPLTNSGFTAATVVSPDSSHYNLLLWARPGKRTGLRAPEDEVLVVFYMRPLPGASFGVLQWAHLYDERIDGHRYSAPPSGLERVKRRYINM